MVIGNYDIDNDNINNSASRQTNYLHITHADTNWYIYGFSEVKLGTILLKIK